MKQLFIIAVIFLSGCTTIHFDNGSEVGQLTTKTWHHNVAASLYEVSEPVNLEKQCDDKSWSSVKTELSFVNAIASGVVNTFLPLWYPKTVEVSCK